MLLTALVMQDMRLANLWLSEVAVNRSKNGRFISECVTMLNEHSIRFLVNCGELNVNVNHVITIN